MPKQEPKYHKGNRILVVDFDKLTTAIKYVSKMFKVDIRTFAKRYANVYNDILYFLKQKKNNKTSIHVSELNKIFTGYGLNPEGFIYVSGGNTTTPFTPEADLLPAMYDAIHNNSIVTMADKKTVKQIYKFVPRFGRGKLASVTQYIDYVRGILTFLQRNYENLNITLEGDFKPETNYEFKVKVVFSESAPVLNIYVRFVNATVVTFMDIYDPTTIASALRVQNGTATRKLTLDVMSSYLRTIDYLLLKYREI